MLAPRQQPPSARELDHLSSADKEKANPQTDQESLGHQIIPEEKQDWRVQVTSVSAPPLPSSPPPLMAHIVEDPAINHDVSSSMENSMVPRSSPKGSLDGNSVSVHNQLASGTISLSRKHGQSNLRENDTLICKHCSFQSNTRHGIVLHEKRHYARRKCQCPFCSYSAMNIGSIRVHIDRYHPVKQRKNLNNKWFSEIVTQTKMNHDSAQKGMDVVELSKDPPLSHETVQENEILQKANEVMEVVDITTDSDGEEQRIEKEMEDMNRNHAKVIREVIASAECFPPLPPSRSSSTPLPELLEDGQNELSQQGNSLPQEEEKNCRSAMHNLSKEIQSAQINILKTEKSSKEEARLLSIARSKSANDLRKKMKKLLEKNRCQSSELAVLMKLDESLKQQLIDLNAQKIQLEIDFNYLRDVFANKKRIKFEPSGLDPFGDIEERIRQKKHRLSNVNQKLTVILKENGLLSVRIRGIETEKKETAHKLTQMQVDLGSLERDPAAGLPSAIAEQLEALKKEQSDVDRKEEEWKSALNV